MSIQWSWSRLDTFEACPLQYYHKNVVKSVPFEQSPAQLRGERIHIHMQNAINGGAVHPEVANLSSLIESVRGVDWTHKSIEREHAYTVDLKPTTWFAKNVWLRIKQDFMACKDDAAICFDWKTGRNRGYSDQLKLYAADAFTRWPEVTTVTTSFVFIDSNQKEKRVYKRSDAEHIWYEFRERVEMIEIATERNEWPAKPTSMGCRYCPVASCAKRLV
jgi:hypothetical protein